MDAETPKTWIAIPADSDFSYHNIPFGVFSTACNKADARPATRVGKHSSSLSKKLKFN